MFSTEWVLCQVKALSLQVSGAFPTWLHGDYIRNGPGTFKGMDHLFDGYGMLVKFSFENGKVTTQQRYGTPASANMPDCLSGRGCDLPPVLHALSCRDAHRQVAYGGLLMH